MNGNQKVPTSMIPRSLRHVNLNCHRSKILKAPIVWVCSVIRLRPITSHLQEIFPKIRQLVDFYYRRVFLSKISINTGLVEEMMKSWLEAHSLTLE
jgi:hypothetical protein